MTDPSNLALNLRQYIQEFGPNVRKLFTEHFGFVTHIERLNSADLLFRIMERFARVDLHPDAVSNLSMGYAFEELIRKFNEQSNETAGEHFTPREVIRLMAKLLISPNEAALRQGDQIRTIFDPTAGTGGMLTIAKERILEHMTQNVKVRLFGQELNPKSFAICKSDLLIQAEDDKRIALGNSLTRDEHAGETFNFMLSNPPFGVEWLELVRLAGAAGVLRSGRPAALLGSRCCWTQARSASAPLPAPDAGRLRVGTAGASVGRGNSPQTFEYALASRLTVRSDTDRRTARSLGVRISTAGGLVMPHLAGRRTTGGHGGRTGRFLVVEGHWTHLLNCCWTVNGMLSVHDQHQPSRRCRVPTLVCCR